MNKALFLDRDGVINLNHGYVHSKDNFDFVDGIFDLVRTARMSGYKVIVVTNQAGIGRGYYTEEQFHELTAWMCEKFESQSGGIDKVYFSPYHPISGIGIYLRDDDSRKPRPGMILKARREFGLSLEDCILVGDKPSDIQAGTAAGIGMNILFSMVSQPELAGIDHVLVQKLIDVIPYLDSRRPALEQSVGRFVRQR